MRITDRMTFERSLHTTGSSRQRMDEAARQLASGSRVDHPGDDPVAARAIVLGRTQLERFDSIARTASSAYDELGQADSALGTVGSILVRAQQLAILGANTPTSATGRASSAIEVEAMISGVAAALNLRVGNRFIFGGNQDASPPFDQTGTYLGDAGVRTLEVAPGVMLDTSLRVEELIKGSAGGVDIFGVLRTLADALAADDLTGISGAIDELTAAISQVAVSRANVGGLMNVLESSVDAAKAGSHAATLEIARQADADPIEAASKLALAQHALDAALTVAAQSFRLSLLDRLK